MKVSFHPEVYIFRCLFKIIKSNCVSIVYTVEERQLPKGYPGDSIMVVNFDNFIILLYCYWSES